MTKRPIFDIKKYFKIHFEVFDKDLLKDDFMGMTEITIKTILETDSNESNHIKRTKEIPLKLTGRPGKKTKQDKDITGYIHIKCSIPPLEVVTAAEKGKNVLVQGLMGNNIVKVYKKKKIDNYYQLPPFEYDSDPKYITTTNALWFAQLSKLAYQKPTSIDSVVKSIFGEFNFSFARLKLINFAKIWSNVKFSSIKKKTLTDSECTTKTLVSFPSEAQSPSKTYSKTFES